MIKPEEVFVPHVGWFLHEPADDVARFLNEGWFEYREQAFVWLYARPGDVFIDCGAHFGLYSVLYAAAARNEVSGLAIDPNRSTLGFLKRNLALHKSPARVLECAVSDREGTAAFYAGGVGKAAYSGLANPGTTELGSEVPVTTLDHVCDEHGVAFANFVKLDIEGSEIAVIRASANIAAGKLPVLMMEFTEQNLQRFGWSTKDLYGELVSPVHRLQVQRGETGAGAGGVHRAGLV